jgi:ubiquinone/menaquinone biosynthesis C-methylase UbiE
VLADWRGRTVLDVAGATATGDLLELPFESRSFDAVVALGLLPHVRNWPRLISELCRVARSTVVIDYPRHSRRSALTPLRNRNFRDAEIDELLRACGFETRRRRVQFLLPRLAHRRSNGTAALRAIERVAHLSGLTQVFGSPVVVRAERWRS